jgi:hydrogenase-4 membrane subunit HyfE
MSSSATVVLAMMQSEVAFDLRSCWDCGLYPGEVAAQIVFLVVVFILGLYLIGKRRNVLTVIGRSVLGFGLFISVLLAVRVPQWGRD